MAIMDETILPPARPVGRPRTRTERPEDYDTPEEIERRRLYMARYKAENKARLLAYYSKGAGAQARNFVEVVMVRVVVGGVVELRQRDAPAACVYVASIYIYY